MLNLVPYRKHNDLYNPFHELEEFERSLFAPDTLASFRTDIEDAGDKLVLSADLPGFRKEDIHVDIDSDRLTINAERHSNYEKKDNRGNYLRCERSLRCCFHRRSGGDLSDRGEERLCYCVLQR